MKNVFSVITFLFVLYACKPVKKVQTINAAINKKDTVQIVKVDTTVAIDSNRVIKDIMFKVEKNKIDFKTFYAKVKVDYEGQDNNLGVTAYIKMTKDSLINLRITYPVYGVVMDAQITKDSVIVVNKKDKYIQYRSINYLQEATQIPFDFKTLQDVIIGNPVFLSKNIVSYKATDNQLLVLMIGNLFKNLITLNTADYKVMHTKLDDVDPLRNRTCDITYSEYKNTGDIQFATYRSISVSEKSKLDVFLDFKDYKFNEPLNYTFVIPKNYKRK